MDKTGESWEALDPSSPHFSEEPARYVRPINDPFYAKPSAREFTPEALRLLRDANLGIDDEWLLKIIDLWAPTAPMIDGSTLADVLCRQSIISPPPPEFYDLHPRSRAVMNFVKERGLVTTEDVAHWRKIKERSAQRRLLGLWRKKFLVRFRRGRTYFYTLGFAVMNRVTRERRPWRNAPPWAEVDTYGLVVMAEEKGITAQEIAKERLVDVSCVRRILKRLAATGKVIRQRIGSCFRYIVNILDPRTTKPSRCFPKPLECCTPRDSTILTERTSPARFLLHPPSLDSTSGNG
jgi:hypothetical protein